jgi:hypothetical protein
MNFERMKAAIKNRELLGLEPFYLLKNILERQQANGWGKIIDFYLLINIYFLLFIKMILYPVDKFLKNQYFNLLNVNNLIQTIN